MGSTSRPRAKNPTQVTASGQLAGGPRLGARIGSDAGRGAHGRPNPYAYRALAPLLPGPAKLSITACTAGAGSADTAAM